MKPVWKPWPRPENAAGAGTKLRWEITRLSQINESQERAGTKSALHPLDRACCNPVLCRDPPSDRSIYQKIGELYGVAGELYRTLGGGKRVLSEERKGFYGDDVESDPSEPRL